MKFSYTALNDQNQKMTGLLEAENLDGAKEELHKMGLSIIIITPISEDEYSRKVTEEASVKQEAGISAFIFNAKDPSGKIIDGTIDAEDTYTAYKRLVTEYHFKVLELYLPGASDSDMATARSRIQDYYRMLRAEGVDIDKITTKKVKELDEQGEMIDAEVVKEIDQFIINAKNVLQMHTQYYSNEFLQEIQKTLADLERVRTSNNLRHISEVSNRLYELISNPDQLDEKVAPESQAFRGVIDAMSKSVVVERKMELGIKMKNLEKIQATFNKILQSLRIKKDSKSATAQRNSKISGMSDALKGQSKKPEVGSDGKEVPTLMDVIKMYLKFSFTSNPILKKARKKEYAVIYTAWKSSHRKSPKSTTSPVSLKADDKQGTAKSTERRSWDFYELFFEADSFIGWLLFFYIVYFFLVDFSLEKGIGLPRDFVVKTLKSPLILNITIFLVFAHLIFKLKNDYFRKNFSGSLFLLFFGFGVYALVVINF